MKATYLERTEGSMPSTPWGRADRILVFTRGVRWIDTPSHGGFVIAQGWAEQHLSQAAQDAGVGYGIQRSGRFRYLTYEEDVLANVVVYEHPELAWYVEDTHTEAMVRDAAAKILSRYVPGYIEIEGEKHNDEYKH